MRHETDRLEERRDELRACACVRRGAPRRLCAWPRCVVLPDPRRDVAFAFAVSGLETSHQSRSLLLAR